MQVRDRADRAWMELRRLAALLDTGAAPSSEQLRELHVDCMGQEVDVGAIADSLDQTKQAACAVIDQVA